MTFRVILTCLMAIAAGHNIGTVGKPQEPTTGGEVLVSVIIHAVVIYGIWNWM